MLRAIFKNCLKFAARGLIDYHWVSLQFQLWLLAKCPSLDLPPALWRPHSNFALSSFYSLLFLMISASLDVLGFLILCSLRWAGLWHPSPPHLTSLWLFGRHAPGSHCWDSPGHIIFALGQIFEQSIYFLELFKYLFKFPSKSSDIYGNFLLHNFGQKKKLMKDTLLCS